MEQFDYTQLLIRLLPESLLVLGALAILFLDQALVRRRPAMTRSRISVTAGLLTLVLAIAAIFFQEPAGSVYRGMLVLSPFTQLAKILVVILAMGALLVGKPSDFTPHLGEYVALLLLATLGLLFLAGTEELLTAFIALELASLSLYLLTGFCKRSIRSAEAALKYFLFGSVAAAFTLFGISLVFGLAGATSFPEISAALRAAQLNPLLVIALVMIACGFAFKMAAAPLHFWAPDVYQGAPIPSAALIASASKLASFILFFRFFTMALAGQAGSASIGGSVRGWTIVLAAIAVTSMILGNLLAIAQSNLRRLLAYSAIAHAGYILLAVLAGSGPGIASAVYYLFTYGLTVVGVFGVIAILERNGNEVALSDLAGLSRRSPLVAICLAVFILSLAGIPPLAGFFAKFYLFLAALDAAKQPGVPGLLWIVAIALATSAVSFYYYLKILKLAFVVEAPSQSPVQVSPAFCSLLVLLAAAVLYLGCFPETLNRPVAKALQFSLPSPIKREIDARP